MRIALITNGLHPYVMGGMQRHSTMLSQHLPASGVQLVVFHTAHSEDAIAQAKALVGLPQPSNGTIEHVFVEYPKCGRLPGHYIGDNHRYSQRMLDAYREHGEHFDFIYAQGLTGRAFIEAKQNGMVLPPIGVNCHGYEMFQRAANLKEKLQHWMLRPTFRKLTLEADFAFSFSGKIRDIVEGRIGVPAAKIIQVPNAVDASWLRPAASVTTSKRRFVFLGRYERRKGIEELNIVLRSMVEAVGFEFHFIGPIPSEKQLEASWVHYHGSISESSTLIALLDDSDVLVCPSHAEGMPTVILEAMARGLAVIATDVGATSEIVDASNGLLLPTVNIDSLRAAIVTMAALKPAELNRMKCASLTRVKNYTWERVSQNTHRLIKEVSDVGSPS
jgi:glycosyltransferase involved in cell wall biosynthesis